MKSTLEATLKTIVKHPEFRISDQDYAAFQDLIKGIEMRDDVNEPAVAFLVGAEYFTRGWVGEGRNREEDLRTLVRIFLHFYRNPASNKSALLMLTEAFAFTFASVEFKRELLNDKCTTIVQNAILALRKGKPVESTHVAVTIPAKVSDDPIILTDLAKFLDLVMNPESRLNADKYVFQGAIRNRDMVLNTHYINGAGYLWGIAHHKLVKVWFNYFEHSVAFRVEISGEAMAKPVSREDLERFFATGEIDIPPYDPMSYDLSEGPRPIRDMDWDLYQSVMTDLRHLDNQIPEGVSVTLMVKAGEIEYALQNGSPFTDKLKKQACEVEHKLYEANAVWHQYPG